MSELGPNHVGIIMDGNRRFSKRLMEQPWKGHEWGAKKLEQVIDWLHELGVREATFYALSLENFKRPKVEFDYLMKVFREGFDKLLHDARVKTYEIKIRFIGRMYMLPADIQEKVKQLEESTKKYKKFKLNFAIAYSGRAEIIDAIKKLAAKGV